MYNAHKAHIEYLDVCSESRSCFNLTEDELRQLNSVISPLLKKGQSLHHIMTHNADSISCCEKTAYVYINNNLFDARNGRTYDDFNAFMKNNPSLPVAELDSVEGVKGSPVLLTVHFVLPKLQLAFYRESNTSQSVIDVFNWLYESLGSDTYKKLFPVLLADNGTEFSNPEALEFDENGGKT